MVSIETFGILFKSVRKIQLSKIDRNRRFFFLHGLIFIAWNLQIYLSFVEYTINFCVCYNYYISWQVKFWNERKEKGMY